MSRILFRGGGGCLLPGGGPGLGGVPAPGGGGVPAPRWGWGVPTPGVPGGDPPGRLLLRAVRILLECILVRTIFFIVDFFIISLNCSNYSDIQQLKLGFELGGMKGSLARLTRSSEVVYSSFS